MTFMLSEYIWDLLEFLKPTMWLFDKLLRYKSLTINIGYRLAYVPV